MEKRTEFRTDFFYIRENYYPHKKEEIKQNKSESLFTFFLYHKLLLVYQNPDANYDKPIIRHRFTPRSLEAVGTIVKPSYVSETTKKMPYAYGMIVKPSGESGTTVIDVWWYQDDPNDNNRQNGATRCDSG